MVPGAAFRRIRPRALGALGLRVVREDRTPRLRLRRGRTGVLPALPRARRSARPRARRPLRPRGPARRARGVLGCVRAALAARDRAARRAGRVPLRALPRRVPRGPLPAGGLLRVALARARGQPREPGVPRRVPRAAADRVAAVRRGVLHLRARVARAAALVPRQGLPAALAPALRAGRLSLLPRTGDARRAGARARRDRDRERAPARDRRRAVGHLPVGGVSRKRSLWLLLVAALAGLQYAGRFTTGKPDRNVLYHYSTAIGSAVQYAII